MANSPTLISRNTRVNGDIRFSGELIIAGQVIGNIYFDDEKEAKLIINDTGLVEGEIHAPVVVVNGKVIGNIHSSKHLELAAKGNVTGVVHYHSIEMVKGAQLNGSMVNNQSQQASPAAAPAVTA
jgi:cytoskeletal protein CcmA (bactofilin family)